MAIADRSSSSSFQFRAFNEKPLVAIDAFAFLIFQVLAGTLVQRAFPTEPADQKGAIVSYDV